MNGKAEDVGEESSVPRRWIWQRCRESTGAGQRPVARRSAHKQEQNFKCNQTKTLVWASRKSGEIGEPLMETKGSWRVGGKQHQTVAWWPQQQHCWAAGKNKEAWEKGTGPEPTSSSESITSADWTAPKPDHRGVMARWEWTRGRRKWWIWVTHGH